MKTYVKKECEVCGKLVSTNPMALGQHMKTHGVKAEPKAEPIPVAPVQIRKGIDGVYTEPASNDIKKLMEIALKAQEERRIAPDIFVSEMSMDENSALVRKYSPDAQDKTGDNGMLKNERHSFFCNYSDLGVKASQGYVPVLDSNGQLVRNSGGDVLTTVDSARINAARAKAQNESTARFKTSKDLIERTRQNTAPGGLTTQGINVTEYSAETRTA